jgi:hypothetical protein
MNLKSLDWEEFSEAVHEHIDVYVVPQYGDKGEDPAVDYTIEDCVRNMKKYLARQGKNSRPGQESLDFIKIAHYAQMAFTLIGEQ